MKRVLPVFACWLRIVLFLLLSGGAVCATDFELKFVKSSESPRDRVPMSRKSLTLQTSVPQGGYRLPRLSAKMPLYAAIDIGDKPRLLILDMRAANSKYYDRIHVDANGNLDFSDNPPIDGTIGSSGEACWTEFPEADLVVDVAGRQLPYRLEARAYCRSMKEFASASAEQLVKDRQVTADVYSKCFYAATAGLGADSYRLVVFDRNVNGRFGDMPRISPESDTRQNSRSQPVYLDGDGLFISGDTGAGSAMEQPMATHVSLRGQLFEFKPDVPAGRVALLPVTVNLGDVALPAETERVALQSDPGTVVIAAFRPGKQLKLPYGSYKLLGYQLVRTDAAGATWQLQGVATWGRKAVSVSGGMTAKLLYGEPFLPRAVVPRWQQAGIGGNEPVQLAFLLEGVQKEQVQSVTQIDGTSSSVEMSKSRRLNPLEPRYRIVDSRGAVAAEGSFEYG